MKVKLEYTEDKKLKGWKLIAETEEEYMQIGAIRNAIFFGLSDNGTYPEYAGREDVEGRPYVAKSLRWKIPARCEKED